ALAAIAPAEVMNVVREQLTKLLERSHSGLLSYGVAAPLWSSSSAMAASVHALDAAYDVEDARPWWKQQLTAILLTLRVAFFVIVACTLVIGAPQLTQLVIGRVGLGMAFEWTWVTQWPLAFVLILSGIGFIYYFAGGGSGVHM